MTDSMYLQKCLCIWIFRLSELLYLEVVLSDLQRYLGDLLEHWADCLSESWWLHSQTSFLQKQPTAVWNGTRLLLGPSVRDPVING